MFKPTQILHRWLPALLIMLVIFLFSAQPGSDVPTFLWADRMVKKGGHMIGYGLLALAYWRALGLTSEKRWISWLLAVIYAISDEFHQSRVPGRNPSVSDVVIFDNFGALLALWLMDFYRKEKRPDSIPPVAEEAKR